RGPARPRGGAGVSPAIPVAIFFCCLLVSSIFISSLLIAAVLTLGQIVLGICQSVGLYTRVTLKITRMTLMTISRRKFMASTALLGTLAQIKHTAFAQAAAETALKDAYRDDFLIGTAISSATLAKNDQNILEVIAWEFNSVTAENAMKWGPIRPSLDNWQWDLADRFVDFGTRHKMHIIGHTLVWHSQVPEAVFLDKKGKPLSKSALLKVMEGHVTTLMERYKDRIPTWDVVNEAIEDDGQWRQSPWYKATGTDYIARAFNLAHELDPKAHLLYNDYNMAMPGKRDAVVAMLKDFKKRGVPIHGVGLQGHVGTGHPELEEFEKSIIAFAEQGVRVHI